QSLSTITVVSAISGVDWRIDEGDIVHCRLITGQLIDDQVTTIDRLTRLRVDTISAGGYLGNVSTWDELPDIGITMLFDPDIELNFEAIFPSAGISYTGIDWFKAVLPSPGDESDWNSIMGPYISTWTTGPWGVPINVEIIPDDMAPSNYDNVFWEIGYSFTYDGLQYNVTMTYHASTPLPNVWHSGILANGTIVARNATTDEMTNFLQLICDPTEPSLDNDMPLTYTEGETDNTMVWQIHEELPGEYLILRNGSEVDSGNMISGVDTQTTSYSPFGGGGLFRYNVDGLSPGVYNFTLVIKNFVGNSTAGSRILYVLAQPTSSLPIILIGVGAGMIVVVGIIIVMKRRTS
ncbi:MAG: hypothetical protein ACXABN_16055, partial [Candidatus Thorarchaeota archaeon]